jgi:hypothetical protein
MKETDAGTGVGVSTEKVTGVECQVSGVEGGKGKLVSELDGWLRVGELRVES